jgi:hypothetical protein
MSNGGGCSKQHTDISAATGYDGVPDENPEERNLCGYIQLRRNTLNFCEWLSRRPYNATWELSAHPSLMGAAKGGSKRGAGWPI